MAIVQNPITGRTRKKFGSAVFSKQFGKNTLRTKPVEVSNPRTEKQRMQRSKFSLMVELSRMFLPFIRIGFKQASIGMSEFNTFMKSNIKNVISGTYPDYTIDFTKLVVSKGTLTGPDGAETSAENDKKIAVTWSDNTGYGDAHETDKAMVLVINYDKKGVKSDVLSATREDEICEVTVPDSWVGDTVHVFLSFMNADETKVANSVYLDSIVVLD
jgi:hypothetical protein